LFSGSRNSHSEWDNHVHRLFSSIAYKYDLGNTLISFGLHMKWKRAMLSLSGKLFDGARIIDGATGTGDIAILAKKICPSAEVYGIDYTPEMLVEAKLRSCRLLKSGNDPLKSDVIFIESDIRYLSMFTNGYFDLYTIGFGLRNIENRASALKEMRRVLKPGGLLSILELSKPVPFLVKPFFWLYIWCAMPIFSFFFSGRLTSYLWLAQSLAEFPTFTALKSEIEQAGFDDVKRTLFGLGVVSLIAARAS
jgi:demethylmenaquinone methyltransferase / 2-methoxy-6-polyprenyl-1,4-benzoquinol methylase